MSPQNHNAVKIIDNLIFIFSIIFLVSLANSIFLNQVGYYGALILLLIKYFVERKNPFAKTGLEWVFLFFFAAEILTTIFSIDKPTSFHNMMKRILLIPTVYVFIAAAKDFKTAKQFLFIYLGASLLTMIYYLIRSYEYFVKDLYQIQGTGPSVFQYPITSSEIMTFSLIILFAFLINEKSQLKHKVIVFILFSINLLALIATYKRTGWMGAAAGILVVIILSRKWFMLFLVILSAVVLAFMNKNVSQLKIYNYEKSGLNNLISVDTEGRAYNVLAGTKLSYVSDFQNGLIILKDSTVISKVELHAPIVGFNHWRDSFYVASFVDTRFVVLKSNDGMKFQQLNEFYTNGTPISLQIKNNFFYVLDDSSNVTIYKNPLNTEDKIEFPLASSTKHQKLFIDSNNFMLFSSDKKLLVYSLLSGLPGTLIYTCKFSDDEDLIGIVGNIFFVNSKSGLKIYSCEQNKTKLLDYKGEIENVLYLLNREQKLFLCNSNGKVFEIAYPVNNKIEILSAADLGFVPQSIDFKDGRIYTTFTKTSRLTSIFDPYFPTNYSRFAFWNAGVKIFKDYPIFGVGDIDLANLYRVYKRPYDREIQGHLHSNYFHSLATLGVVGFTAIMLLLISVLIIFVTSFKKLKSIPFGSSYSIGAIGSYCAFLVAGLTEYNFGDHEVITLVWFTLALTIAFAKNLPAENQDHTK